MNIYMTSLCHLRLSLKCQRRIIDQLCIEVVLTQLYIHNVVLVLIVLNNKWSIIIK